MTLNDEIARFDQYLEAEHEDLPALRTRNEVCSRCRGEGELGGYPGVYTQDDFDEDPDFFDDYIEHRRTCEDCNGRRVTRVVDREASHPDTLSTWDEWCQDMWEMNRIYEMERRMGA